LSPDIAVSLVEADAVGGAVVDAVAALEPAVDDVGDDAVAGDTFDGLVRRRGGPLGGDGGMPGGLGGLLRHPEPDGGLEGDSGVDGDEVRVIEQVGADGLPGGP
jgi:hypothetical protein